MFSHARHQAPLAVDSPSCPAHVGPPCTSRSGQPAMFHESRKALLLERDGITDAVRDRLVEMVSTLQWMRKVAGGVEGQAMRDVITEIGLVIAAAKASVSV